MLAGRGRLRESLQPSSTLLAVTVKAGAIRNAGTVPFTKPIAPATAMHSPSAYAASAVSEATFPLRTMSRASGSDKSRVTILVVLFPAALSAASTP